MQCFQRSSTVTSQSNKKGNHQKVAMGEISSPIIAVLRACINGSLCFSRIFRPAFVLGGGRNAFGGPSLSRGKLDACKVQ